MTWVLESALMPDSGWSPFELKATGSESPIFSISISGTVARY